MTTVLYAVLVLGALIFFHELGHFAVARWFGMGVSRFSLGFGTRLFGFKHGKTDYCISLIPLGGYVALVGETDGSDVPEGFTPEENFSLRPAWQRLLVVAAGPIANFILAWVVCVILAMGWGMAKMLPEIGGLVENGAAAEAGMQTGDRVLSINGKPIHVWKEMSDAINESRGEPMHLEIRRGSDTLTIVTSARSAVRKTIFGEDETAWMLGIRASGAVEIQELGFLDSFSEGTRRTWEYIDLTWQGFVKLAQRVVPADQVGGPIMIAQLVGQSAEAGLAAVLGLAALISINLGILNLLPVPVLDGGQIVFCVIEMIIRRPLNERMRDWAMRIGITLLLALMVLATYNDIARLLKGTAVGSWIAEHWAALELMIKGLFGG